MSGVGSKRRADEMPSDEVMEKARRHLMLAEMRARGCEQAARAMEFRVEKEKHMFQLNQNRLNVIKGLGAHLTSSMPKEYDDWVNGTAINVIITGIERIPYGVSGQVRRLSYQEYLELKIAGEKEDGMEGVEVDSDSD
jgi:hypothetical protein